MTTLKPTPSVVGELPLTQDIIQMNDLGEDARNWFEQNPHLQGILVYKEEHFVQLISRREFFERMTTNFGWALFIKNTIHRFMELDNNKLILHESLSIEEACHQVLNRKVNEVYDPIVIKKNHQYYCLDCHELLLTQNLQLLESKSLLQKNIAKVEAAARAKSNFLATMSHEIRTPMNGVIGLTSILKETTLDEDQKEFVRCIESSSQSLLTIINDVLDYSKIDAGKMVIESTPFNLKQLLIEILRIFEFKVQSTHLILIPEISEDIPNIVMGDPNRLRQVFNNLIGNAIKFTDRGYVKIKVKKIESFSQYVNIKFEIEDTGIGIAKENLKDIFKSFTQEDNTTTRQFGGTGLGLSISQQLIQLMGSRIHVHSEKGIGSNFYFTLPINLPTKEDYLPDYYINWSHLKAICIYNEERFQIQIDEIAHHLPFKFDYVQYSEYIIDSQSFFEKLKSIDLLILSNSEDTSINFKIAEIINKKIPHNQRPTQLIWVPSGTRGDDQRCQQFGISGYLTGEMSVGDLDLTLSKILHTAQSHNNQLVTRYDLSQLKGNLLIVDDNLINLKLTTRMTENFGFNVKTAVNGQEAIDLMQWHTFDIVIMDLQMPVLGGIEAVVKLRKEFPEIYKSSCIIAFSANVTENIEQTCFQAGMHDYLAKPFKKEQLLEILKKHSLRRKPTQTLLNP